GQPRPLADWMGSLVQDQRDQSGLLFRRNRYYDPATGQFTQQDPIGIAGGMNLYGFANGDPVNFSDPFGLSPCLVTPTLCAAAAGAAVEVGLRAGANLLAGRDLTDGFGAAAARGAAAGAVGFGAGKWISRGASALRGSTAAVGELTATHSLTLSRRQMSALVDDIAENGIQESIKFVEHNGGRFVVDGHHRLAAARRLGISEVPVERVSLPYGGYRTSSDLSFQFVPRGR
ncbi:MAG: RHS repeat-associated core domain-containing protein, partial [Phycisphaerales bacterium JB038]